LHLGLISEVKRKSFSSPSSWIEQRAIVASFSLPNRLGKSCFFDSIAWKLIEQALGERGVPWSLMTHRRPEKERC